MTNSAFLIRGAAPETPRFIAVAPESLHLGAASATPAIRASESALGSHLCVALSSAQVFPDWTSSTQPCNDFALNGHYPLTGCLTPRVHFTGLRAHSLLSPACACAHLSRRNWGWGCKSLRHCSR